MSGWELLAAIAGQLLASVDHIRRFIRSLGVSQEDLDEVMEKNRKERAAQLDADRTAEWPPPGPGRGST